MRLTDRCQIEQDGTLVGGTRRCEFGHVGGSTGLENGGMRYTEQARVIVGPDPALAGLDSPTRIKVIHKGKSYRATSILPRYRPGGRLHHVSLDLETIVG